MPGTDYAGLRGGTTLLNQGTVQMGGTYDFGIQGHSFVDNQSLWEIISDVDFSGGTGSGGTFTNTGTFRKSGGSDVTSINGWWIFQNNSGGIIDAASGTLEFSKFDNLQGSIVQGIGSIDVPSTFINNGIVAPGNSAGILTYIGNYLSSETASLAIELGGLNPGSQYDQLIVSGKATLNGSIDVSLVNGYIPDKGETFTVLTSTGAVSSKFAKVNAVPGLFITVQYNPNDVTIVVDSVGTITGVDDDIANNRFELKPNYPNPFTSITKISFEIKQNKAGENKNVSLCVYDITGKEVVNLINQEEFSPGTYDVNFDGTYLNGGQYFYRLQYGNFIETRKMILLK